jgi:hypothetical protein
MNLENMKQEWAAQEPAIEAGFNLRSELQGLIRTELRRAEDISKTKSAFRRVTLYVLLDQSMTVAGLVLNGIFIGNHYREMRFLLPAIVLHLALLGLIVAGAFQHEALSRINFDGPITEIQARVERLRILRIRITQAVCLLSPLLWLPLLVVGLRGVVGIDAYRVFDLTFWIANLLFGLAWIPFAIGIARRFGGRFSSSRIGRQIVEDITGSSLAEARRHLRDLAGHDDQSLPS